MRAYLTRDDQLVVRDGLPADAVALWHTLHGVYLERRGPDPAGDDDDDLIPATTYLDVIELINAFEGLAGSIRGSALRGLDGWRHGYLRTLDLIARADDRRGVFPHNRVVWLGLTWRLAAHLAAAAPLAAVWSISV